MLLLHGQPVTTEFVSGTAGPEAIFLVCLEIYQDSTMSESDLFQKLWNQNLKLQTVSAKTVSTREWLYAYRDFLLGVSFLQCLLFCAFILLT